MFRDPRDIRLAKDHEKLDELCRCSTKISYEILKQPPGLPPSEYKIIFRNVKSITGIKSDGSPKYGLLHELKLSFPPAYPGAEGAPKCVMLTDIWHPNIRSKEPAKGRVCINSKDLGAWHTLELLVMRLGAMLQYKNYHALDEDPWPEDADVARWVRETAEPRGIVDKKKGIYVDDSDLLDIEPSDQDITGDDFSGSARMAVRKKVMDFSMDSASDDDDWDMSFTQKDTTDEEEIDFDFEFKVKKLK